MKCEQRVYKATGVDRGVICGKPASYVIDPYIAEIFEETQYRWLCPECFDDRKDDI